LPRAAACVPRIVAGYRLFSGAFTAGGALFGALEAGGRPQDARLTGEALSRVLLAPVLGVLPAGTRRLLIGATGELADLPFAALPHPTKGDLLLHHFEVTYVPSLQLLAALRTSPKPTAENALVFADPVASGRVPSARRGIDLGPLPHALREGKEVAAYFREARLLEGRGATPRAVIAEAGRFGVLHFATHAVTDRQAPMNLALVLSPEDSSRSGWITAREISSLSLDTALVTLSACQSSAGPRTKASSAPSLAKAFLQAGSRSVVAGLWDADDAATRDLMNLFYEELSRGETVGGALRLAQQTLARTRDVSQWAGFVVVGDPDSRPLGIRQPRALSATSPMGGFALLVCAVGGLVFYARRS